MAHEKINKEFSGAAGKPRAVRFLFFTIICIFSIVIVSLYTGLLVIQNAQQLFCTTTLDRSNYWAEFDEILHGALLGDNSSNYRGIFGYSVSGPRYGVPLGPQEGTKNFEIFFLCF